MTHFLFNDSPTKDELFVYWTFRRSRHNIFEGLGRIEHVCVYIKA